MQPAAPILLYCFLTLVLTLALGGLQGAVGIDAAGIVLPQLAPGLAAVLLTALLRRFPVRLNLSLKRDVVLRSAAAFIFPLILGALALLIYTILASPPPAPTTGGTSLAVLSGGVLLGAFGEELGWRGYLQQVLQERGSMLTASLLTGLLWGLWHVGNYARGPVYMVFFVITTIGASLLIAWFLRDSHHNVFVAWLFHAGLNAGFIIAGDALLETSYMLITGLVWWTAGTIFVLLASRTFTRRP